MSKTAGAERIAELLAELDGVEHRACSELVSAVLELHGEALAAMMQVLASDRELVDRLAGDPRIAGVLLLYGLHPKPAVDRVRAALRQVAGIEVKAVTLDDGVLAVHLVRDANARLGEPRHESVHEAIVDAAPEIDEVRIDGLAAAPRVIPISAAAP